MILENINCKYIKVSSDYLNNDMASSIVSIDITSKYNCCDYIYTDKIINLTNKLWRVELLSGKVIKSIIFKNIYTDQCYTITLNYKFTSCSDTNLTSIIKNTLISSYGINAVVNLTSSGGKCYIEVSGLPAHIAMDKLFYGTIEGDNFESLFYYQNSSKGSFLTSNNIYITSGMFSEINPKKLQDGIYTFTIMYTYINGEKRTEEACFFFDNEIKCKLTSILSNIADKKEDTDLHLIHYALVNGNGCNCYCAEMCKLFEYLWNQIQNHQISVDCGCK